MPTESTTTTTTTTTTRMKSVSTRLFKNKKLFRQKNIDLLCGKILFTGNY